MKARRSRPKPAVRKRKGNVYHDSFVADQLRRGTPTQVKVYRRLHTWHQQEEEHHETACD
jgi:hypothetical protein